MRNIPLWHHEKIVAEAIVDDQFYDALVAMPPKGRWLAQKIGQRIYAAFRANKKVHYLHHEVFHLFEQRAGQSVELEGREVHHTGPTIDNRLTVLVIATHEVHRFFHSGIHHSHPRSGAKRCLHGHSFAVWGVINSQGQRVCRLCQRIAGQKYYHQGGGKQKKQDRLAARRAAKMSEAPAPHAVA